MSLLKPIRASTGRWLLAGTGLTGATVLSLTFRGVAPGELDVVRLLGLVSFAALVGLATAASP